MFDENTEMLIERFFDGSLTVAENGEFERRVANDPALKLRIEDDAMVRSFFQGAEERHFKSSFAEGVIREADLENALSKTLSQHKAETFSPNFSQRVIDAIGKERADGEVLFSVEFCGFLASLFPKVAAPAAAVALVAMVANVNSVGLDAPIAEALLGLPSADASEFSFLNIG